MRGGERVRRRTDGRPTQLRLRDSDGSALIIALVFLTVFAVLATLVADLGMTTFKASEVVSKHGDTLFGADDTAERVQSAIQTPPADPVCDVTPGADTTTLYDKDGRVFKVRCSYMKQAESSMPGYHLAMMLTSTYPDALLNRGLTTMTSPVPLSGNIRLNTDMVCFVVAVGAPCSNRPDLRTLTTPPYGHVGPFDLWAYPADDGSPAQPYIEIPKTTCPEDGSWLPNPVDFAGAQNSSTWDPAHLRTAQSDGSNPQPFTSANWKCRPASDPEYDLYQAEPHYPVPDTSQLPTRSSGGTMGNCSDYGSNFAWRADAPTIWPNFVINRVRHSCIRWFEPGRYTQIPTLDLETYATPTGSRGVVRANVFKPGLYWFDSDAAPDAATPWFPDPGANLYVRNDTLDAPVIMGTVHPAVVANTGWNNIAVTNGVPLGQRCTAGDPGVQLLFNPGYGVDIDPGSDVVVPPAAQISACHLQPSQGIPGSTPGVVIYQRKYDQATWEAGFSNWPNAQGQHVVTLPKAPAWGTFALFNSQDNAGAGGMYFDGTIYAPHGLMKTAVGLSAGTAGTHMASGIIAWALHTKGFGNAQLIAGEQPTFVEKMQVEIWDCGPGLTTDTALVDACDAGRAADAVGIVDVADPSGSPGSAATLRFDRWLPS